MGINSPHIVSIHILDDDSLLNIFYLYRPFFLGEDENDYSRLEGGRKNWDEGNWWYRLAQVSQRWRNLIFGSASYLRLSLVCTNGTPVENMLTHSPPLPLTVDYYDKDGITTEDEEGILLALQQRHRVRHLRLLVPFRILQKLVMAIDEEFPILEYLIVLCWSKESEVPLMLPETLQAPNLQHLALQGFTCPIRPRLHPTVPTAASLVTLNLLILHPSAYFQPNILRQWISFMPQLECLCITFDFPVPNRDVERQLAHAPITTHITLPNLRLFWFRGASAYLEAVVCRITAPRLERLYIRFFKQLSFSIPRVLQFMNSTENLRFDDAKIMVQDKQIFLEMFLRDADPVTYNFRVRVDCWHLDWQVSSIAQISNGLSQVCSSVESLTFEHEVHSQSSEGRNDVDPIQWRNLLGSFSNVKSLHVEGLVEELSRCLQVDDGGHPASVDLLPELQELAYTDAARPSGSDNSHDVFTSFIDARRNTDHPVTVTRVQPN